MATFLDVWDILTPAATDLRSQGDDRFRELKRAFLERYLQEHDFPVAAGAGSGRHKFAFGNTASRPTDPATGTIYFNTQTGIIEQYDGATWQSRTLGTVVHASARVFHSADQDIVTGVTTALTFNSERYDATASHDGVNPTRLTATEAGVYYIFANISWQNGASDIRFLELRVNGATVIGRVRGVSGQEQNVSAVWKLALSDYVECVVNQNSVGNLKVNSTSAYSPEFGFQWLSV